MTVITNSLGACLLDRAIANHQRLDSTPQAAGDREAEFYLQHGGNGARLVYWIVSIFDAFPAVLRHQDPPGQETGLIHCSVETKRQM